MVDEGRTANVFPLGLFPTERLRLRLRRRKQLGSVNFYATFHIWRRKTSKENFAIEIAIAQWERTFTVVNNCFITARSPIKKRENNLNPEIMLSTGYNLQQVGTSRSKYKGPAGQVLQTMNVRLKCFVNY